ncbi:MAG: hypothetical protein WBC26_07725 [Alphaproteobacteria bacterium]|nr:hypothetical protein [Alphaproteobacteria bacterium]MBP7763199.1 hypothetical protein [Alphaproteobacteria bacterium]
MSGKNQTPNADPTTESVVSAEEAEQAQVLAQAYLRPTVLAAATIKGQHKNHDILDVNALISELSNQVSKVREGDLGRAEAMLISQAHTLDSLFAELINRSRMNMGEYFHAADKYMRLALKAQGQCRATLETLAAIKNPQPYIQNNKAQYQQVNNGTGPSEGNNSNSTRTHAHAGKNLNNTNGLLEEKTHEQEWLDTGTPETAGGNDT